MIETLGKPLTAEQVRQVLGIGINQVYANAQEIGGVKIGGKWVFFESNVLAALRRDNADQSNEQTNRTKGVVRESHSQRADVHEKSSHQAGCAKVGACDKGRTGKPAVNRHGLRITERAIYGPATRLSPISRNEFSRTYTLVLVRSRCVTLTGRMMK